VALPWRGVLPKDETDTDSFLGATQVILRQVTSAAHESDDRQRWIRAHGFQSVQSDLHREVVGNYAKYRLDQF